METETTTLSYLISFVTFVISVFSFVGLIFLTQLSFNSTSSGSEIIVDNKDNLNTTKIGFARFTVVLLWINTSIYILFFIFSFFVNYEKTNIKNSMYNKIF